MYKDIEIQSIELYEDRYYLKGVSFTYLCDGWRSEVKSHLQLDNGGSLSSIKKKVINFKKGL